MNTFQYYLTPMIVVTVATAQAMAYAAAASLATFDWLFVRK